MHARQGKLASQLKKRQPFDLPEQEAYLNLIRTAAQLGDEFDALFRSHGISHTGYNILRILRGAGGDGLPSLEVAARLVSRMPDITRLIDRLARLGLVSRERRPPDRRCVYLRVTPGGLALLDRLDRPVERLHRQQLGHMSEAQLEQLSALLEKARDPR